MLNSTHAETTLPKDLYEKLKVELYSEIEGLVVECQHGHGDKQLLWSIRKVRHELLKSLSASAGVEYPVLLEWLTDQERIAQKTDPTTIR